MPYQTHEHYDAVLEGPREGETYLDWHRRRETYRIFIRTKTSLRWPYAYDKPVEFGGMCLECEASDGSHKSFCEAVL